VPPDFALRSAFFPLRSGNALSFEQPESVLVARRPGEVWPLLREVDAVLARGRRWVAGFLAYEAAAALDQSLTVRAPSALPLACFAVCSAPLRRPLGAVLGRGSGAAGTGKAFEGERQPASAAAGGLSWTPSIDAATYADRLGRAREAIARGETYQVNLTWRLAAPFTGSAAALFGQMLAAQPVPHAAFVDLGAHALCSLSPELFFRRRGALLVCRPMKGTAPRGRYGSEDDARIAALVASEKERAENLMIVDMVRNDLGRLARAGSVRASRLCRPERYATLWQLTSTVTAESDAPLSAVMAALFPSASVTGAPKPRTMELIAALEDSPRGPYTGVIGWAGPGRRARFNVAIRTVWVDRERGVAEYGTGGGVTWASSAAAELAESRLKASVLLAPRPVFQLLETLRWTPALGYRLLAAHLARLRRSARHFGFCCDDRAERTLLDLASRLPPYPQRVRLRLAPDGAVTIEAELLPPTPRLAGGRRRPWRVALAPRPVDAGDPLLFHKTTHRRLYDEARAAVPGCDDALLWNADGEVTESTVANLVARLDGALVTPPVSSGLLAGTFRERLLQRRCVVERVVRREDLGRATGLWLVNSVRGWLPAELVELPRNEPRASV
jgi:para-aminobenzoate synthetase/4-amino-4-deoxychorismate lyase